MESKKKEKAEGGTEKGGQRRSRTAKGTAKTVTGSGALSPSSTPANNQPSPSSATASSDKRQQKIAIASPPRPPSHFALMTPSFPPNGSPFRQPAVPYAHPSPAQSNGTPPATMPSHIPPQYQYVMAPGPYAPYPYPQYPQQVLYMHHPRPLDQSQGSPSAQSPASASTQPATGKRKRKSVDGQDNEASEGDAPGPSGQAAQMAATAQSIINMPVDNNSKKRTKTQRACDSCRSRKIRCDVLANTEPPVCHHCKQYGFECTFFLPIAETRFKKKKIEEEQANAEKAKDARSSATPHEARPGDPRICGPTSEQHLLHSTATIPSRVYESYDVRHHHTWEVTDNGDGLIQVREPNPDEAPTQAPRPVDMLIDRSMIEQLVNAYFTDIAPILPVITQKEFLALSSPPPILLYSICLVAAARREVAQSVFDSIRFAVNNVIKTEDVLSTASIANVQSLLILCMVGDCHSQFVPTALSALWIRLGTAIRMAQDMGLHRVEAIQQNVEARRRIWAALLISDRWTSLSYGHPYMIDVNDCDVRLPSTGDPNDLYMDELVRLSIILGRVLKTIYSPSGLTLTNDEMLYKLLADIENWKANLPESLQFRGPDTPMNAGLLFLLYSCVSMIFWRVFMRISYSCPAHLKFGMTVEKWSALVKLTGDSIDWLDKNDKLYDVWLLVAYAATSCALVQYHTWARRQDPEAALKLKKLRDCIRRWERSLSPDHMSARRKTAEIIALLYESTQGPPPQIETPALNPTGGVTGKKPPPLGGLQYSQDPSRPGGGVFIAHGPAAKEAYQDVDPGTIIGSGSEGEEENAPVHPKAARKARTTQATAARSPTTMKTDQQQQPMVNFTPLGGGTGNGVSDPNTAVPVASTSNGLPSATSATDLMSNLNPAMNASALIGNNVQLINMLDGQTMMPNGSGGVGAAGGVQQSQGQGQGAGGMPGMGGPTVEQMAWADNNWLEGIPGGMFDWGQWDEFFARLGNTSMPMGMAAPQQQQQQQQQPQQQQQGQAPNPYPHQQQQQQQQHQQQYAPNAPQPS